MMPSSLIHPRTETRHRGRLSPASTPACTGPQDWPVIAPQIPSNNVQSARSYHHPRQTFEPKPPHRWGRTILPNTCVGAKSP
jgi:hypothetical protein